MTGATYIVVFISCLLGVESLPHEGSSLRIVGGHAANITEVPYMARCCSTRTFRCCGAAILNERYLISSAVCYYHHVKHGSRYALVGTDQIFGDGEAYLIKEVYTHPKFIPIPPTPPFDDDEDDPQPVPIGAKDYDVILLKLTKDLKFSDRVQPIPLADENLELSEGAMLDTMGFGSTSAGNDYNIPGQLQKVSVPFMSQEKCRIVSPGLTDRMICAGAAWKGSGRFDDGGPLVYDKQLVGVLSAPRTYGEEGIPSIYTSVLAVRDFIDAVIQNKEA